MSDTEDYARSLCVAPSGDLWVGIGSHADLVVWDPRTKTRHSVLPPEYKDSLSCYGLSVSGNYIYCDLRGDDRKQLIFDATTEQVVAVLDVPPELESYRVVTGGLVQRSVLSGEDAWVVESSAGYVVLAGTGVLYDDALPLDQSRAGPPIGWGNDQPYLFDAYVNDGTYGKRGIARLYDTALMAFFFEAQGFDSVTADGSSGGTNTRTIRTPLDYLLTFSDTWLGDPWP